MSRGHVVEQLATNVTRFGEALICAQERSYFYLIEGRDADCLIDSGWGLGWSLADLPRKADKPLIAVATHSHFDHVGRLFEATVRLGHPLETELFSSCDVVDKQAFPYLDHRQVLADGGMLTRESFHTPASPLTGQLTDGGEIDLGGVRLEVLHTPGHSPGSLSLIDERSGFLFCADTVHDGHIHDDIPGADRRDLISSHERLRDREIGLACPGHGSVMDFDAFAARIAKYAASVETISNERRV